MAFMDYGCCVRKNGKIVGCISSPLKYKRGYHWEGDELVDNEDNIDETMITYERENGEKVQNSAGGNNHGLVGDKDFMVLFYKTWVSFAKDSYHPWDGQKELGNIMPTWEWFVGTHEGGYRNSHKKPLVLNIDTIGEFIVKSINPSDNECNTYIAEFKYKGDKYSVLFGYGVYSDPKYFFKYGEEWFGKKSKRNRTLKKMAEWYSFPVDRENFVCN